MAIAATDEELAAQNGQAPTSLATAAARNLATTTKTVPQMQGISSRWLLRLLPWVQVSGGTYRVNRRLAYAVGSGRVSFSTTGDQVSVIPPSLVELAPLRGFEDQDLLNALAGRFVQEEYARGQAIVEEGTAAGGMVLIVHGKADKARVGKYGDPAILEVITDGDALGVESLVDPDARWDFTATAVVPTTVMRLTREALLAVAAQAPALAAALEAYRAAPAPSANRFGEADIELMSGHRGEQELPATFADYETSPREYDLAVAQTALRVHSRVADLYNDPMNQVEQQLRLTTEALRERQEHEMMNNPEFGLLHNADLGQRISTRTGPPTPDDMDDLLAQVWKSPTFYMAHPRTIAAFGRECSRRGIYPQSVELMGNHIPAWRGIPFFPCNKVPISETRTSSILLMRTGEAVQGVVGLHQTGIPDEVQPSLNVRFMNIDEKGVISYLVSAYYSVAVLVPDALGILENVEVGF